MILEIDNVELNFSEKKILSGVYFKSKIGNITGILGRNGCGKSSLLKIVFGSLKPKHKLLRLDKKPVLKAFYTLGLVKYLPQHQLFPDSIKIKDAFFIMSVDWYGFTTLFPEFSRYENSKSKQISGGELRVIETYLILKSPSKFILLDEPFSHIAPLYIEKIKEIIMEEKHHKAIIITDHLYEHVLNICDELYFLKNGHTKLINSEKELTDFGYTSLA